MKKLVIENRFFIVPYFLFLVTGAILIATQEKGDAILYANSMHTNWANHLFKWVSYMAEWPLVALTILIAIRFSYGRGLILLANNIVVLAVVQFLKRVVFADQVRPFLFFEGKAQLNFIEGVEPHRYHSFPSGHTAGAFAFLFMLSLLLKDKRWGILLFALALLVGISRVYLLQHFFRDIYAGSFVAVAITSAFYLFVVQSEFYQNLSWKDRSMFRYD